MKHLHTEYLVLVLL